METATLQLPKDLIEAAIRQQVQAAMAAAMGDQSRILSMAVHQVLTSKVDPDDGKPGRGYGRDVEFIQWAVQDTMKKAIKDALAEEIAKHKDRIQAQLVAELQKKNSPLMKQLVTGMVEGAIAPLSDKYRFTVNLEAK